MPDAGDGAEGAERRSSAQGDSSGNRLRGNCYEGSGCPTTSSQASAWEKDAACPGCVASELGKAARREAAGPRCDRRPTHERRRSSAQGEQRPWGKLRSVKRPACFQRQTGACRSCGLAVSQPCRGHEEPVGAQDLSATGRRTPTDQVRTKHRARSVPGVQRQERSTPTARLMSSGVKRSTPTRRTGVQRAKDQRQLRPQDRTEDGELRQIRRFDPRCLRRTNVNSASAAVPSWETGGERIILRSYPCNRDHAPRFLWSETLEKA